MKRWIASISYHHNNPQPTWYANVVAENEDEALLHGFKTVLDDFDEGFTIEDLRPILNQDVLYITSKAGENYVLWNEEDFSGELNRGIGWGNDIDKISKLDNTWLEVRERNEYFAKALEGYKHRFGELPEELITKVLDWFDTNKEE
jgi:hypothetical protein